MAETSLGRSVLWGFADGIGLDHCRLSSSSSGHVLTGTVVTVTDWLPVTVRYSVWCDPHWHTRGAQIAVEDDNLMLVRSMTLSSDGDGNWTVQTKRVDGESADRVTGCIDVDLAFTPATNTLPIRRHDMAIGATIDVSAAWVQFPSLELAVLHQRYTRVDRERYRFEAPALEFVALMDVDELGLVTSYEGLWQRITAADFPG